MNNDARNGQAGREPFGAGDPFPLDVRPLAPHGKPVAVAVLSLYCAHCIEMLPHLVSAVRSHRIPFVLVSNGTPQENAGIATHFHAAFPIVSVAESDIADVYRVSRTPYFYFVHGTGIVAEGFATDRADDLAARWLRYGGPYG